MSRPSEAEINEALELTAQALSPTHALELTITEQRIVLRRLRAAVMPRPVWPAKEVAEHLGVNPANLRVGRMQNFDKFPAPAQELPRPTGKDPGKTVRFWFVDEVQDFKRDYMKGGQ